jgi:catechol 2,3-dioxygenase-like lactoylglutathione lyase family enzyme
MASDPFLSWANRTVPRPEREEPYVSIQDIVVFVRDLDVSKRFYVDQLGFELITEQCLPTGVRWIEVAPPDGSANLALVEPKPDPRIQADWRLPLGSFHDRRC